ncbi:MAG TPA: thymidine phosphorylase [Spirochaetia bacterium]|nr:thymidine phosphorylase [Spirochaetia bacterium]
MDFFIREYVDGNLPDYQVSALLMAIWFRGMDDQETADLTLSMAASGDQVDLSRIPGIKVDKHSTGGVADTTTLVVAPLVAACGGKVAKMSGRGLGHTGGTLDKLESIPGFSISQSMDTFVKTVTECGLSVIGQTANLVPADKKLYALRDVTGTVDNLSLIASSIMSKKLASGSDAIVLDVKTGSGAFMKNPKDAERLARVMVEIGRAAGRKTLALVTDMNQPLGNAIGNAIEVQEAIEILRGQHPGDLKTVSFALAAQMLIASEICRTEDEAVAKLDQALSGGAGLERLRSMIEAQGGDTRVCDDTLRLPQAREIVEARAPDEGFLVSMDTESIGISALLLGAGRLTKEQQIDPAVGIWLEKRIGDRVGKGEVLARFYVNDRSNLDEALERFIGALQIGREEPKSFPLIYTKIE